MEFSLKLKFGLACISGILLFYHVPPSLFSTAIPRLGTYNDAAVSHRATAATSPPPPPKALFTHEKGQLHCMDRELIHGCVPELLAFLEDKHNTTVRLTAKECVQDIYHTSEDFWEIKNMTHLLLDLDSKTHAFDDTRDNEFISLGYDFAEKLIFHPECVEEFDTKDPLECRCAPLFGKIILLKLKNANMIEKAQALFKKMKEYEWHGKRRTLKAGDAFQWQYFMQTPQTYMPNLTATPVWNETRKSDLPIWATLEDNFHIIKKEYDALSKKKGWEDDITTSAYPFLFSGGKWDQIILYTAKEWGKECEFFPETCALLKEALESRPVHYMPWTSNQNEQVIILKMTPKTDVEIHSGPGNNILNIHLGIAGTEGAVLMIANKTYHWEEGKVIAWDGSFDHRVHCHECEQDRVVMLVRYMHPEVTWDHYRGNRRTHFEEIPVDKQQGCDFEDEKVKKPKENEL